MKAWAGILTGIAGSASPTSQMCTQQLPTSAALSDLFRGVPWALLAKLRSFSLSHLGPVHGPNLRTNNLLEEPEFKSWMFSDSRSH